jgi:hypothetical protein
VRDGPLTSDHSFAGIARAAILRPNRRMKAINAIWIVGVLAVSSAARPAKADLYYVLQPGSSITPWYNGHPNGPSQPMTGTFTWQLFWIDRDFILFEATSLSFQSLSFRLTLDTTAANDLASSVSPYSNATVFSEVVDGVSLPGVPLVMFSTVNGSYEGSWESPTLLTYPGLFLSAPDGHIPFLSFTATQVPEPTALVLLIGGLLWLTCRELWPFAWRRQRRST